MKVYILTTPCSGKTFYAKKHNDLYDVERLLKEKRISKQRITSQSRQKGVNETIKATPENAVLIGMPCKPEVDNCKYLAVLISEENLKEYLKRRSKKGKWKKWKTFEQIKPVRKELKEICSKFNIPIYNSIQTAICEARKYI